MKRIEEPEITDPPDDGIFHYRRNEHNSAPPVETAGDFTKTFYPTISQAQWNDWRWQCSNSITAPEAFERILDLTESERRALACGCLRLPARVTPYYASLFAAGAGNAALRRTMVPCLDELIDFDGRSDPLAEDHDSPVPNLVHRYPDRALLLATDACFAYCRYCTRSRRVGKTRSGAKRLDKALQYIAEHREIRDVIVSGGDPLTLSDDVLDAILTRLRAIPHLEILRIGTKAPMVLPQRITPALAGILGKHHPLYLSLHCTHPAELTPESRRALGLLADAGIPLGSQTVLLQGVNQEPETMRDLFHGLLKARVRPYYLYHCDPVSGAGHFRTTVAKGIEVIENLRGHTSGYAVPQFVIDLPGGGGKIPVLPEYLVNREDGILTFRNYEGKTYTVNENESGDPAMSRHAVPDKEIIQ